ncbi:MAG: restriction endonuclease subunit S [Hydrogenophaga sp.]|uniref:restriction endonuclease subunit S n=1 Tax=Hydrogenophaga sp. TaxID=1904254 RepID=UPI00272722B9|nr:restriction endonuclease subunit S [Hydrogenophaga sp.]MDO9568584.1 restriction endonuclease subunit S [Hydrogenophaga sp.]MDP3372961.1 restriction endonuclease subunit S [Hydrogenophaga sp.]
MSPKTPTTERTEEARPALVPKLRFPEFRGTGEWEPVTLREAATSVTERVGEKKLTPVSISAGIGFVPQAEKFGRDISGNQYQLYVLVRDGDFVFNKGNSLKFPQGCVYLLQGWGEVAAPNVFICFRLKNGYANGFFQQCFEQNQHGRQLKRHITSGARSNGLLNISKETFFDVEIPTPSPAEQQKIADCLSSLDELLAAQARKVDALKTHKKGLMQQLFPREGETQPRLRFPEFQNAGEWIPTTVGGLVEAGVLYAPKDGNHGSIHPKSSDYVANGIPFIMASDLNGGLIDIETCHFISKEQADTLQKGFAKEGDVLLSHKGTVGEVAVVRKIHTPYLMLTPQVTYYRVKDRKKLSNEFLAQLFVSMTFQSNLLEVSGGGTRAYIGITEQAKLRVQLPKDADEQQRIADCLTSIDDLIAAQTQKHEALKTHKKGLMQQLFPALSEVEA